MKFAQPALLVLAILSILTPGVSAQTPIQVTAPEMVEPDESIFITAEISGQATNVTLVYTLCTATTCGFPNIMPMEENGTFYQATIPGQKLGFEVEYQVTALVDGVNETSEIGKIGIASPSGPGSRDLELYVGLGVGLAIVGVASLYLIVSRRKEDDEA